MYDIISPCDTDCIISKSSYDVHAQYVERFRACKIMQCQHVELSQRLVADSQKSGQLPIILAVRVDGGADV